jgi:hypothetical protein
MNWKQIFCNHIWKETDKELLEEWKEQGFLLWRNYSRWGVMQRCIKCDKTRLQEKVTWKYGDRIV